MIANLEVYARPICEVSSLIFPIEPVTSFVILSQGWPSAMIALSSLDLPVLGAYFPAHYHRFFNSTNMKMGHGNVPQDFDNAQYADMTYVISGSAFFIDFWLSTHCIGHWSIIHCEMPLQGSSKRMMSHLMHEGRGVLNTHHVGHSVWSNELFGGGTDASFLFGFGSHLSPDILPHVHPSIPRELRHFLNPKAGGFHGKVVPEDSVPSRVDLPPLRQQMYFNDVLLPQGLFSSSRPQTKVYCP